MKIINCKTYTKFNCNFIVEGSDTKKMKDRMSSHLETQHIGKEDKKFDLTRTAIREIMQQVDNNLMKTQLIN